MLRSTVAARHILVHEQPRERPYPERDIPEFFSHSAQFVAALEWLLLARLYGHLPRTQLGMDMEAKQELEAAQAELAALRGGTADEFANPETPAAELEHHWDRFCELSARIRAGYTSGEPPRSIAPLLYASELSHLTRWRIDDIKEETTSRRKGLARIIRDAPRLAA